MIESAELPPRVADLVACFEIIGAERMRGLPVYNDSLGVEAVGFRPFEDGWLGVLVTPWFMNLVVFPQAPVPWDPPRIGKRRPRALPCGEVAFLIGGDEGFGHYESHSIRSPMQDFHNLDAARAAARDALDTFLTPPATAEAEPATPRRALDRRAVLAGRLTGGGA